MVQIPKSYLQDQSKMKNSINYSNQKALYIDLHIHIWYIYEMLAWYFIVPYWKGPETRRFILGMKEVLDTDVSDLLKLCYQIAYSSNRK